MKKRMREIKKLAEPLGWQLLPKRAAGHYRLQHRSGILATCSATPSDRRGDKNLVAMLNRLVEGQK